ncbi:MAG: ABC transporter substrate-binding protein [Brachybacterium sp.]|nr:ABC transporter substrate-binding protein [Brachybacterium sp.]
MNNELSRRGMLAGTMGLGGAGLLTGCLGGGTPGGDGGNGNGGGGGGSVTLQSSIQDEGPKRALAEVVGDFDEYDVTVNSVATEQFRAQLSTYLTSPEPPDVLTWYAGSVANSYAREGLLLDVSELWEGDGPCANFSEALRELSSDEDGNQIFVPTNYYWWSIFYRRSMFEEWGISDIPTEWDDFLTMCEDLEGQGITPLTNGIGATPWMASGWFDYLNCRVNGPEFHRELLAGEHSFDSTEVRDTMERYAEIVPFLHENQTSWSDQEGAQPLVDGSAAMYLVGAFVTEFVPSDVEEDLDFFSVPKIADVPSSEEAPTDGFFLAAGSQNPEGAMALASYLATKEAQEQYIEVSGSSNLPTSPDVDTSQFSPLVQKGIETLNDTDEITQFFNRDSSDELQATADTALTQFIANPDNVDQILAEWQSAAEQVFQS